MFFQCFIVSVIKVVSRQGRTILRFCFESFKRSRTNVREESPGCEMGTNSSQSWREKGRSQSGYEKIELVSPLSININDSPSSFYNSYSDTIQGVTTFITDDIIII